MKLIDAAGVNGPIDWLMVSHAGVKGAFVKATEGVTFDDPRWTTNRKHATEAGVAVGAYHFARPDRNAAAVEAKHFCARVGKLGPRDLRPVLDYETKNSLSPAQQVAWIKTFNKVVRDSLGVWPIFYTYSALIPALNLQHPIGNGLWIANYGRNDGLDHGFAVPKPWRKVAVHQFTSKGHVPGISGFVDMDWSGALPYAHPVKRVVRGGTWKAV